MKWTDYAQAVGSIATAAALIVALWAALVAAKHAKTAAKQAEQYEGAQSAIAWREQVLALHDRGLRPGQIRYIMHLEDSGAGYEGWNGRIDDIVAGLSSDPVRSARPPSQVRLPSCDAMPVERYGCTGPCQNTLQSSGCAEFRERDGPSPNATAGYRLIRQWRRR